MWLSLLRARVRIVRGEGRGVSDQYGVRDAACPLSTREWGWWGGGRAVLSKRPATPHCRFVCGRRRPGMPREAMKHVASSNVLYYRALAHMLAHMLRIRIRLPSTLVSLARRGTSSVGPAARSVRLLGRRSGSRSGSRSRGSCWLGLGSAHVSLLLGRGCARQPAKRAQGAAQEKGPMPSQPAVAQSHRRRGPGLDRPASPGAQATAGRRRRCRSGTRRGPWG